MRRTMMTAQRVLLLAVVAVALVSCCVVAADGQGSKRPNIVILLADDLGYGDIAAYGHPTSNTPHLDRLVQEGLKFLDFYSASPVCSPSRAGILTGRYQTRNGVYPGVFEPQSLLGLPHSEITIAEALKEHHNYNTAIVGKWHLGVGNQSQFLPTTQGFDQYTGIPYSHDMPDPADCFRSSAGDLPCFPGTPPDPMRTTTPFYTADHDAHARRTGAHAPTCKYGHGMEGNFTAVTTATQHECLSLCEQHSHCVAVQFFARECRMFARTGDTFPLASGNVCYTRHTSSLNPSATTAAGRAAMHLGFKGVLDPVASGNEVEIPLYRYESSSAPRIVEQPANLSTIDRLYTQTAIDFIEKSKDEPFFLYFAMQHTHHPDYAGPDFFNTTDRGMMGDSLFALDWSVGQIMQTIRDLNLDNDTFVFFTCSTTWEGGQRVPAVARWPGRIRAGRVTRDITSHLDILPTVLSIADIPLPTDRYYDGTDMSPILFHEQPGARDYYFYWAANVANMSDLQAVRWREWKMHFKTGGSHAPNDYFVPSCRSNTSVTTHDPPLLFNLYHDPGEHVPLDSTDPKFKFIVAKLHALVDELKDTPGLFGHAQIPPSNPLAQPCCDPTCRQRHPDNLNECCRTITSINAAV
ncbi:hypothetical protein PTSG_05900 [Salpingoeca rosetta]|uniref:Sulfatase N-terminal domain-containing protein n=1 Tax=Salpingoeca rosetta (strain ATCC 50818 / BSB-021) TaxID=946362 RepID=F2UD41_SALR5|nr:uncharacterized protein PTSG_05900 [Salpingoeca rosetta]EGD74536.1 hypothetical protein PTSG_05900 [Salpingoeca rosetta]|eukprot:XP_004992793.1 hypothetical protein PTSG_05900 [Salpingoeca rosetta]